MSRAIEIPALENGMVRVFALSLDATAARALKDGGAEAQSRILGTENLDPAHVEVFPISDLGDLGLPGYMIDGAGAIRAEIVADWTKLAALDGWVMVLYSGAFRGVARSLSPAPELTLIGSYRQEGIDWSAPIDLSTPSALPTPRATPAKRPSDAAMSGRIAVAALAVAFFVVALMLWVGS